MAERAVRRETTRYVSRIRRAIEICLMAAVAGGGQRCVVIIYVALCAGHSNVRARERERSRAVIERCPTPVSR